MELKDLKNKHEGERCFIIATGPSLNKTNLSLLKDEICIGMNTLYRGLKDWGFTCKYYAVSDPRTWNEIYEDVLKLDTVFFLSEEIYKTYPDTIDYDKCFVVKTVPGYSMWVHRVFSTDMNVGKVNGDSILICCLQFAFYMGFKTVCILGCDWCFGHFDEENASDTTKDFLETGDSRYSMDINQRLAKTSLSCRVCKAVYESNGREIINCTKNGNLELFKRISLEDVVSDGD